VRRASAKTTYGSTATCPQEDHLVRHIAALGLSDRAAYRAWCAEHGFGPALAKSWRQRRDERLRAAKLQEEARNQAALDKHIRDLGLRSADEYAEWCERRGRSASVRKRAGQLARERKLARLEHASGELSRARASRRSPETFLRAVFEGSITKQELRTDAEREIYALVGTLKPKATARQALLRLLVRFRCDLESLVHRPAVPHLGMGEKNTILAALLRLAHFNHRWLKSPETWRLEFGSARRRFGSLLRHLVAEYPTPAVFDSVWFEEDGDASSRRLGWYLHIASGQNLRKADLPYELTTRMVHHVLRAPSDISIEAALRWGQIIGMGGNVRLARAILGTRLAEPHAHEEFWATVVRFFVNNPMLDPAQVGPIVDYLHHQRFVNREVRGEAGAWERIGPAQPQLSMKGRTATALVRLTEEWHRELAKEKRPPREWRPQAVQEFRLLRGIDRDEIWTVHELLSSKELQQEGKYMSNCVATYASSCASGACSIWSLRKRTLQSPVATRIMTIELTNKSREVVQVRGRFNVTPSCGSASEDLKAAVEILRQWVECAGLNLSRFAY